MSISFWLLDNFSTAELAVIVVGGLMLLGGVGLIVVHRRWPDLVAGEHNDVAGVLLGIVGAIYGIMLAFVVVAVYTSFSDAENNVRAEASYVAQLHLDTRGLDIGPTMTLQVGSYVHDVVEDEWPTMEKGGASAKVEGDLAAMFTTMQTSSPASPAQDGFFNAAIDDLNGVVAARRDRLFDAQEELPTVLQILLIGGAVLLIAFTWLFGMRHFRTQLLMVLGVAALVGFSLLVAMVIDHPFSGDVTVSSEPFRLGALAAFW